MEAPARQRDRRPLVRGLLELGALMILLGLWFWVLDAPTVGVAAFSASGLVMVAIAIHLSRGLEPEDRDLQDRRWPPLGF